MLASSPKILVDVIADNLRSRNTLEFAISRHSQGKMDLGLGSNAHLAIVDCDGPKAKVDLQRYHRRYPQRPLVLLLTFEKDLAVYTQDAVGLIAEAVTKPLKLENLILAIEKCMERRSLQEPPLAIAEKDRDTTQVLPGGFGGVKAKAVTASYAEVSSKEIPSSNTALQRLVDRTGDFFEPISVLYRNADDIDLNSETALSQARLRAGNLLLGRVHGALQHTDNKTANFLAHLNAKPLFRFIPAEDRIELLIDPATLPHLISQEVPQDAFVLTMDATSSSWPRTTHSFSREAFLWRLALLTYHGRIPEETDPHERVYLSRWPNMTRLDPVPDGLRIAALWIRMPVDLCYSARVLRVPQRHVFLFYAAANAIGIAGPARRASNYLFEPSLQQHIMPHTMLARLAGHFGETGRASDATDEKSS